MSRVRQIIEALADNPAPAVLTLISAVSLALFVNLVAATGKSAEDAVTYIDQMQAKDAEYDVAPPDFDFLELEWEGSTNDTWWILTENSTHCGYVAEAIYEKRGIVAMNGERRTLAGALKACEKGDYFVFKLPPKAFPRTAS